VNAIKTETTIDEATAEAIPALRPLLGKRVELIALQTETEAPPGTGRKLTLDELLAARLVPAPGVGPVSLEDMERAIEKGATSGGG
jgi:hypothetical protein